MTTKLIVGGMSCDNCVRHVKEALEGVSGVETVNVTLDPGEAIVEHNGVDLADLIEAIKEEGYVASAA